MRAAESRSSEASGGTVPIELGMPSQTGPRPAARRGKGVVNVDDCNCDEDLNIPCVSEMRRCGHDVQ